MVYLNHLNIMKQITLNIDETKFKEFMNLLKSLDYVSVSDEIEIPLDHQVEVNRRLSLLEDGKLKTRSWEEAKKDIFKNQ